MFFLFLTSTFLLRCNSHPINFTFERIIEVQLSGISAYSQGCATKSTTFLSPQKESRSQWAVTPLSPLPCPLTPSSFVLTEGGKESGELAQVCVAWGQRWGVRVVGDKAEGMSAGSG